MKHGRLSESLGMVGAALLGIAYFWWLAGYAAAPGADKLGLDGVAACLVLTNDACAAVRAEANLSYTPILFWASIVVIVAAAVLHYSGRDGDGSKGG